jgi:hypothetical protein
LGWNFRTELKFSIDNHYHGIGPIKNASSQWLFNGRGDEIFPEVVSDFITVRVLWQVNDTT